MSCYSDYLNTLGELEGFIESQRCDHTVVVGDFNVDFDRGGSLASLLTDFIVEHDFVVCDLSYRESVKFTYERDDGLVNSWIDHVVCSQSLSLHVTDVHTVFSGTKLSDHLPLCFNLHISCTSISVPSSSVNSRTESHIIWSKATPSSIMSYQDKVFKELLDPPLEFLECTKPACTIRTGLLNDYANHIVSILLDSACCCFPSSASFNGIKLSFMDQVVHLGHVLTDDLDDTADILRAVKDLNQKANSLLCTFKFLDPLIMSFLLKFYCLSLYGCCLWSLNTPAIRIIEIALNKVLWKIWHLPSRAHTGIVHCVAQVQTISNMLYDHFQLFFSIASSSSSRLIRSIITESGYHVNCFTGYNVHYGYSHVTIVTLIVLL